MMANPGATRKSVTLPAPDAKRLARVVNKRTGVHEVLKAKVSERTLDSESAVMRALIRLGMDVVEEEQLQGGYEALARSETGEDTKEKRALLDLSARAFSSRD